MSDFEKIINYIKENPLEIKDKILPPKRKIIGKKINGVWVEYEVTSEGVKTNDPN